MTESDAIRARHAVRNYTTKPLSPAVIDGLKEEIEQCNRLGQLHIQLVTENDEAFKSIIPLFGRFKCKKLYCFGSQKARRVLCGVRLLWSTYPSAQRTIVLCPKLILAL